MSQALCCAYQPRIDSPEPPSRRPHSVDGIFAAAALPEDHPHAIKWTEKKPGLDASIIRSPGVVKKLKSQFRRKSLKALLVREEEYDGDALAMTSTEVFNHVGGGADEGCCLGGDGAEDQALPQSVFQEAETSDIGPDDAKIIDCVTPLVDKEPSDDNRQRASMRPDNDMLLTTTIPHYASSPNLLATLPLTHTRLRRTQSYLGLGSASPVPKTRMRAGRRASLDALTRFASFKDFTDALERSSRASSSSNRTNSDHACGTMQPMHAQLDGTKEELSSAGQAETPRLHTMEISQQLRSMSQLSDPIALTESDSIMSPHQPWKMHQRELSDAGTRAAQSCHSRQPSGLGMDVSGLLATRGRVRSPAVSSCYSRPSSEGWMFEREQLQVSLAMPYEIPGKLIRVSTDWPLRSEIESTSLTSAAQHGSNEITMAKGRNLLPACPEDTTQAVDLNADNTNDTPSDWLSPLDRRAGSMPSKSSSSTLTEVSKASKFLESFSPPKKTVRKRLSIFKFLRPGSGRHQARSNSTPVLTNVAAKPPGAFDGQADDPGLLSVHYETTEQKSARAASLHNLTTYHKDIATHLGAANPLQRRPTLADYERNLTATGDDRRKPSTVDLRRLKEVHQDDHPRSLSLRRKLSRAKPLKFDDENSGLMAHALQKHQQEKALFRSASKQRESLSHPQRLSTTRTTPGSSLPRQSADEYDDLLDPLDQTGIMDAPGRAESVGFLSPSPSSVGVQSNPLSYATQRPSTTKIGTSLTSWSRYPSHTRAERSGPAGISEHIVARDFALEIYPAEIQSVEEPEQSSPQSKRTTKSKLSGGSLPRSRSSMFVDVLRYYGNLFTTGGSTAQNRRTSVTTSGWLANPDLEMLPPISSAEPHFPHHDHHFKERLHQLEHHLEQQVMHDIEQVEAEASKLLHLQHHPHNQHNLASGSSVEGSPFRQGSIFAQASHAKRESTFLGPNDEVDEDAPSATSQAVDSSMTSEPPVDCLSHELGMDGTIETCVPSKKPSPSKADEWSALYKECLSTTDTAESTAEKIESSQCFPIVTDDFHGMPPPALKPVKPRSPEQLRTLDPKSSIRRFPSVTVVDDRKGHSRSVSLISVKFETLGGNVRTSTNDLLHLIEAKEKEELEKLLRPVASVGRYPTFRTA